MPLAQHQRRGDQCRRLMAAWQAFWRKDGHLAADGFGYREPVRI